MPVTLGAVSFDETHTTVREKLEEVGGRNERRVTISGLVLGESAVADIEVQLDAILDAASVEDYSAALSLRAGRRLLVRRNAFKREIRGDELVGAFTLELEAREPFEESEDETQLPWAIAVSGATLNAMSAGTLYAEPVIAITATGTLINPAVSDGTRTLAYSGSVADGETLVIDGVASRATLEGADVTPYTTGAFPRIPAEGATLTYTDDAASSHTASATVTFRDRWW